MLCFIIKIVQMKKSILLLLTLVAISCKEKQDKTNSKLEEPISDNIELIEIYENDQSDRQTDNIDWNIVSKRDSLREKRVYELLDSSKVRTSKDYQNAAMVFQHGGDSIAYGMAVKLMRKSIELDSTANKWLLAAAIDRDLLSRNKPQIYGTQYHKMGHDAPWTLGEIDTTKVTDEERIKYGVETLAQQREKVKNMNRKKLSELRANGKTIDQIIKLIGEENKTDSKYDLSENGLNSFGYSLLSEGENQDALKIFKLNTELYPLAFNTYDSYGECLLILGEMEKGIEAYKKSLELNPDNENAKTIISQNEK